MKQKTILICLGSLALMLAACDGLNNSTINSIEGSGNITTKVRTVSDFSRIQINLGADLVLTQGESESLTVEADDNLMQYIETKVEGGKLIVTTPDNTSLSPSQSIQLSVSFEELTNININGSSNITAEGLDLDELAISFSGSGSTKLSGSVDEQDITIRGMATIHNYDLTCDEVTIDISGSGTIEVTAEDTLDVTVAGMGSVHYAGSPTITQDVSGSATIAQRS